MRRFVARLWSRHCYNLAIGLALLVILAVMALSEDGESSPRPYRGQCSLEAVNKIAMAQDDPCLIRIIREQFFIPPSGKPYKLERAADPSVGQAKIVRELTNNQTDGFFVECGALDGETSSNTIFMERFLNWKGLLIEADPKNLKLLAEKHRKAWTVPACVSNDGRAKTVSFHMQFDVGRASDLADPIDRPDMVTVQCFPLYSILLAANRTKVDFFSLDIEGDELKVLKTIPWDRLDIKILAVEYLFIPEGKAVLAQYMAEKGYYVAREYNRTDWRAYDYIFMKSS